MAQWDWLCDSIGLCQSHDSSCLKQLTCFGYAGQKGGSNQGACLEFIADHTNTSVTPLQVMKDEVENHLQMDA